MSHAIGYRTYHCSISEKKIMADLNTFAYDPEETSCYHGNLKFHKDIVCKNREEAEEKLRELDKGWYDDHAVYFKDGRKKFWLVKYEYHT
jgi:thermostable 8-oxoguanine DNA glycosylase